MASRWILPASVAALGLLTASCRLPSRETWNQVQQRGLIPVLMASNPEPAAPESLGKEKVIAQSPGGSTDPAPLKVQAVQQPEIAKIPFATAVPGRPGYVFSPHTPGRKLVDVRNYPAGAEVRCPYTMHPFNVPDFSAPVVAPAPQPRPQRSVAEVASSAPVSGADPLPIIPRNSPPAPGSPSSEADIPYGSRVPGRIGFVYSPFADKNQLVDVAGIAPGVEVKCPYSNKLFRVPEPLAEEMTPAPANVVPEAPPSTDPAAAPQAATPPAPAPKAPTASWSDKDKNLVQSPFGTPGQLVDVSGRAAGSAMQCPFTNKEFIIPAH
jgi:hypothetical protein